MIANAEKPGATLVKLNAVAAGDASVRCERQASPAIAVNLLRLRTSYQASDA